MLMCATGQGKSTVDSIFAYDDLGFPFIGGRRFKGLLRESFAEIMEIKQKPDAEVVKVQNMVFGVEDTKNRPTIKVGNFYPIEANGKVRSWVKEDDHAQLWKHLIIDYYSYNKAQTAIADDGIAKVGSLRNFNLLRDDRIDCFVGTIELLFDCRDDSSLLENIKLSVYNLRYIGTSRNRGLGYVSCSIADYIQDDKEAETIPVCDELSEITEFNQLDVTIWNTQPVINSKSGNDKNTISTHDYLSGSILRGILMSQAKKLDDRQDELKKILLSGDLSFTNSMPDGARYIPLSLRKEKYGQQSVINVIAKNKNRNSTEDNNDSEAKITKSLTGLIDNDHKRVEVSKSHLFHSTRKNDRMAGKSTAADAGIFYYESISANTVFKGAIRGEQAILKKIITAFGNEMECEIGRSKYVQYGDSVVCLRKSSQKVCDFTTDSNHYMVLQSSLIVLNADGIALPTLANLKDYLKEYEINAIEECSVAYTHVEQYNAHWKIKTDRMSAFAAGSTFLVKSSKQIPMPFQIGEKRVEGFGQVIFYTEDQMKTVQVAIKTKIDEDPKKPEWSMDGMIQKLKDENNHPGLISTIIKDAAENVQVLTAITEEIQNAKHDAEAHLDRFTSSQLGRIEQCLLPDKLVDVKNALTDFKDSDSGTKLEPINIKLLIGIPEKDEQLSLYVTKWKAYINTIRKILKGNQHGR